MGQTVVRRATAEDADFTSWAILVASRGHLPKGWFDIALHRSEQECIEFLKRLTIAATPSRWHYSRFIIAEAGGHPVATLSAFRAADAYSISTGAISETAESLGLSLAEQEAVWKRGAYQFTCVSRAADDAWVIENVAVLPNCRGKGYMDALLERALVEGRAHGLGMAQITFLIGNRSAERSYERAGFRFANDCRHPDFEAATGSPGLRRVVRPI